MPSWSVSMDAGDVIAALALGLSMLGLWLRYRDRGRASFVADWSRPDQVRVVNIGTGPARHVTVAVGSSAGEGDESDDAQAPHVPPQQSMTVTIRRSSMVEHGPVELTWRDNRLRQQSASITLGMPPPSVVRAAPQGKLETIVRDIAAAEIADHERFEEFRHRH